MTIVGGIVLGLLALWLIGGVVLRVVGALTALAGLVALAFPSAAGDSDQVLTLAMVLVGSGDLARWSLALRLPQPLLHSPLAERILGRCLPARVNPSVGWSRHGRRRRLSGDPRP
jgi:hypothetical protein